jgi:sugar O-acyltransferase (sialic acid O-acetyltransferase NeuD family)
MKRLAIVGASGHGKVVADIAEYCGWEEVVFFDDAFPKKKTLEGWSIVGDTQNFLSSMINFNGCIVAIGDNITRLEKTNFLLLSGAPVISLIHPSAIVSKYSSIKLGSVVKANVVIDAFSKIGLACILGTSATLAHDCKLMDAVHVSPGANLAGSVEVDQCTWLGIGSTINQGLSIGKNVIIGAGSVVINDMPDNVVAVGIPSKVIKSNKKL